MKTETRHRKVNKTEGARKDWKVIFFAV